MKKKMIFHLPYQIHTNHAAGPQIRPLKMIEAFEAIGYEVDVVMGHAKTRKKQIAAIAKELKTGSRYTFVYSESSNDPTLLTEPHHLPLYPRLDFSFFKLCKNHTIPIGLFYRDVYWKFPFYGTELSRFKKAVALFFYRFDLKQYANYLSILYLPSIPMLSYVPIRKENLKVEALPPGCEEGVTMNNNGLNSELRMLYVGGVGALYNFGLLMASVSERPSVKLTVCCREEEWQREKANYEPYLRSGNITVVHKRGAALISLYNWANIVSLYIQPSEYRNFAMPVKFFEYMQYGKPMIGTTGSAVSEIIDSYDLGWTIGYDKQELDLLLDRLITKPEEVVLKAKNVITAIESHTWQARARQVEKGLMRFNERKDQV